MVQELTARRRFLSGVAAGATATLAASRGATAADNDGHGSGYDAATTGNFMKTVPRKPGDPVTFSVSLDRFAAKSTSGRLGARDQRPSPAARHRDRRRTSVHERRWLTRDALACHGSRVGVGAGRSVPGDRGGPRRRTGCRELRAWRSVVLSEGPCARHLDAGRRALPCAAHLR
jgi:hypothetical protein